MTSKKSKPSALDYDPLAWLDDGEAESDDIGPDKAKKQADAAAAQSGKRQAKNDANAQSPEPETVAGNAGSAVESVETGAEGYGFFDEEPDAPDNPAATGGSGNEGYGFFDEEPGVPDKPVVAESEPEATQAPAEGYGFFDDEPGLVSSQAARFDDNGRVIETGADLSIRSVAAFKQLVDDKVQQGLDVIISTRELQKIDTAGVQLLYSLNQTLARSQQSIAWESPSSLVNDVAALLGMPRFGPETPDDEEGFGFFSDENDAPASAQAEQDNDGFGFF